MNYRPVANWGTLPEGMSFVEATSVAVDAHDDVYVFNRGKHPVIVFDRAGRFKRTWGEGVFRRAHGITIGPDGSLWLTDDLHHTIRQFTPEGKCLLTIGDPVTVLTSALSASIGVMCLAAGLMGWLRRECAWWERALLVAAALLLIKPGYITDVIGLVLLGIVCAVQWRPKSVSEV